MPSDTQGPRLKDYLPYMTKQPGGGMSIPSGLMNSYSPQQHSMPATAQFPAEPMRQATLGGPADFNRKLKPVLKDSIRPEDNYEGPSMGVRPTPVGSEQTTVSANFSMADSNSQIGNFPYSTSQPWPQPPQSSSPSINPYGTSYVPYQYPSSSQISPMNSSSINSPSAMSVSNVTYSQMHDPNSVSSQSYNSSVQNQNSLALEQNNAKGSFQQPFNSATAPQSGSPRYGAMPQPVASIPGHVNTPQENGQPSPGMSTTNPLPHSVRPSSTVLPSPNVSSAFTATGTMSVSSVYQPHGYNVMASQRPASIPPTSSITSPPIEQSNMQPHWQTSGHTNHYTPGYNMQTPVYNQNPSMNNYQQVVPPAQYYQQSNARQSVSSVTASMDTRTSTFNSSSQISGTNPNMYNYPSQQNTARYSPNQSDARTVVSGNSGNVNLPSPYHGQPQNQNYGNPSMQGKFNNTSSLPLSSATNSYAYQNSYGNMYGPSNQNFQNLPQSTPVTQNATFAGAVGPQMNVPNVPPAISPNHVTQPTNSAFQNQTPGHAFQGQQTYQQPSHPGNQYNYSMPNVGFPATNQHFQPSLESASACQPLQPSPTMTVQNKPEVISPARNGQPVISENSHFNAIRDLITPPLEKESSNVTDSAEKDASCQVLQPKVKPIYIIYVKTYIYYIYVKSYCDS